MARKHTVLPFTRSLKVTRCSRRTTNRIGGSYTKVRLSLNTYVVYLVVVKELHWSGTQRSIVAGNQ